MATPTMTVAVPTRPIAAIPARNGLRTGRPGACRMSRALVYGVASRALCMGSQGEG
jgi:hypothetical protein